MEPSNHFLTLQKSRTMCLFVGIVHFLFQSYVQLCDGFTTGRRHIGLDPSSNVKLLFWFWYFPFYELIHFVWINYKLNKYRLYYWYVCGVFWSYTVQYRIGVCFGFFIHFYVEDRFRDVMFQEIRRLKMKLMNSSCLGNSQIWRILIHLFRLFTKALVSSVGIICWNRKVIVVYWEYNRKWKFPSKN